MNEVGAGATSGALQWGTVGFMVGGPAGAIVGGIAGGIAGGIVGGKARKARKFARKAAKIQQQREANAAEAQFLQYIREGRMTRASSLAASEVYGINTSSLSTSALSSVGSQLGYNIQFLGEDRRLYQKYKKYMSLAGRAAQAYQTLTSLQNTITSLGMSAAKAGLIGGGAEEWKPSSYGTSQYATQSVSTVGSSIAGSLGGPAGIQIPTF